MQSKIKKHLRPKAHGKPACRVEQSRGAREESGGVMGSAREEFVGRKLWSTIPKAAKGLSELRTTRVCWIGQYGGL